MNTPTRLALLGACFLWAVSFVATRVALETTPPLTVVALRLGIASACFGPLLAAAGRWRRVARWDMGLKLLGLSLFGGGLHYGLQTLGLQTTFASNASVYAATGPITILLLAAAVSGERITRAKLAGITLAVVGVLVIIAPENLIDFSLEGGIVGDLLVLASIVMWGCFTVFGKGLTDSLGALTVTASVTVIAALWMAPIGWLELQQTGFSLDQVSGRGWLAIGFLGGGCSFLAVLLYFHALQHTESQKVGVYLYAIPPMTAVAAAMILSEPVTIGLIAGTALVIAGVALTERG